MATRQAKTNRANAKKSTGPKTAIGKQAVRHNAIVHGLSAGSTTLILLPAEDPAAFDQLREGCQRQLKPEGDIEETLVVRIVETLWRLGRATRIEAGILGHYYHAEQLQRAETEVEQTHEAERRANDTTQMRSAPENDEMKQAYRQALARRDSLTKQSPEEVTVGDAFLRDAASTDALGKLSRYETALSNHLQRLSRLLGDLQDQRLHAVEPVGLSRRPTAT
ncbi:MAG: hypothetical protein O2782_17800 [bacterium]|nr:hypothetical protein [bacterium]